MTTDQILSVLREAAPVVNQFNSEQAQVKALDAILDAIPNDDWKLPALLPHEPPGAFTVCEPVPASTGIEGIFRSIQDQLTPNPVIDTALSTRETGKLLKNLLTHEPEFLKTGKGINEIHNKLTEASSNRIIASTVIKCLQSLTYKKILLNTHIKHPYKNHWQLNDGNNNVPADGQA